MSHNKTSTNMKRIVLFTFILIHAGNGQVVTCPGQYIAIGNGCYTFAESPSSWFDANLLCQFSGGYLANIGSDAEQSALKDYRDINLSGSAFQIRWIGASDSIADGTWRWVPSGEALSYSNWMAGSPSADENKNCAFWDTAGNTWNSYLCCVTVQNVASVCEADPIPVV